MPMHRSKRDVLAGVVFVVFGAGFAWGAFAYPMGTVARIGPGFYPLVVAVLLVILGVAVAIRPSGDQEEDPVAPPWRAIAVIFAAILLFGLTVRGLGLAPSIFIAATLASFASVKTGPLGAVVIGAALTVVSVLIFVVALRLNLPLLGPWLRL